ncbi:nitroreductase family protein [Microbacterium esteraromaticum]|uniref:nitroreductase family protein n=1 Tax=Microbacterium esteraromaticum TaxID=57043 RepID=UPI001CD48CF2|nr:nitroreductase family protein [Microbacterium esteraromaticum]MCA1307766.1 nitroreductase family protein [Microbacterium esteraromaticum]
MNAREAALARTSWSKVTEAAPTRDELVPLIEAAGRVADHSSLRPWRLIELRGDDRLTLGAALAEAAGDDKPSTKPLRASLLIAIVASYRKTDKVPRWEQEAVASGVAHTLSLLLDEAGWGVIWRTGGLTRAEAVARAHGLHENEELLGWLYVGGKPEGKSAGRRKPVDVDTVLTRMPDAGHDGDEQPPTSTDKKKSKKKTKKHKKKSKKD